MEAISHHCAYYYVPTHVLCRSIAVVAGGLLERGENNTHIYNLSPGSSWPRPLEVGFLATGRPICKFHWSWAEPVPLAVWRHWKRRNYRNIQVGPTSRALWVELWSDQGGDWLNFVRYEVLHPLKKWWQGSVSVLYSDLCLVEILSSARSGR
ncbi:hypothetical protein BGZ63DRAFT_155560 [Mariannaea sp. PMI_226]|nr:hypothetical protein BGZ63DRAFT_155560 [Mariannaea sp. PMI_226]